MVSTHSRAEAAAGALDTQKTAQTGFQHTAAWRRLPRYRKLGKASGEVSTHSRAKAAAFVTIFCDFIKFVSTHSRPKVAAAINFFQF
ncbi:hypothetical protein HMPREF9065_01463 [Aggregatibacter sp. oral taxon 458 str. W10330]|nr:hypothetical protein HMPREF9065_01463 [Aggregatibacter sp. oral taxon 458 str. W10330]